MTNEKLTILMVSVIAVIAMFALSQDASNIVSAVAGGLVGYLTKGDTE